MGAEFFDAPAWRIVTGAEDIVGRPLAPLLLDDALQTTEAAQLAVLLHSLMSWETAPHDVDAVAAFAGHSLGQMTALIASGVLSFEDGIRIAARRAALTQDAAVQRPGVMAALLGASDEQAQAAVADTSDSCWIANINAPGQIVIAGTPDGLEAASGAAKAAGVRRVVKLDVAAAFHTPLMSDAASALATELTDVTFNAPSAPVVSNHDGVAYDDGPGWRDRIVEHLVLPVRWADVMTTIGSLGVDAVREVGPGTTLTALAKRCLPDLFPSPLPQVVTS